MTCIVRTPLLDPEQGILGYKLAWQGAEGRPCAARTPDLGDLAACVERLAPGRLEGWTPEGLLFLEAPVGPLSPEALAGLRPAHTVVCMSAAELDDPSVCERAQALRDAGFGLCVRDLPAADVPPSWLPLATHLEFDWGRATGGGSRPPAAPGGACQPQLIAAGLAGWEDYRASAALGINAFVDGARACDTRIDGSLSPQSLLLLQLMQMVKANVDVHHIETALRRDPTLAYQLLRYLNSPSFGLGVEVQSLRHAVAMMGYGPLLRWLALLLASSHTRPASPVLMQAAVIRGRFAELLGRGMLPARDAENLFVAGMFSLLDRLLGVRITEVLDRIQLPQAVVQALLGRQGIYGPFVRLAEACESPAGDAAAIADSALVTTAQVNAAHVAALAWAVDLRA